MPSYGDIKWKAQKKGVKPAKKGTQKLSTKDPDATVKPFVLAACNAMGPQWRSPGSSVVQTISKFIQDMHDTFCTPISVFKYTANVFQMLDQVQVPDL